MKKTIIFDLDGTIADSESFFFRIVNDLAPRFSYAPLGLSKSVAFKELHLWDFLRRQLGWRIIFLPFILKAGRQRYHELAKEVSIFSGIQEIFSALRERGARIGIVSSSAEPTIRTILETNGLTVDFIAHSNLFGKARVLKRTLREQALTTDEIIYIGDEVRDVEACRKAGIRIIAVTWGLNSQAALRAAGAETVDTRKALLERLIQA